MKLTQILIFVLVYIATSSAYTGWYSADASNEICFDVNSNASGIINMTYNTSNFTFTPSTIFVENDTITSHKYYFNLSTVGNTSYILYTPTSTHKSYCFYNDVSIPTKYNNIRYAVSSLTGFNNCSELQTVVYPPLSYLNYSISCDGNKSNITIIYHGMTFSISKSVNSMYIFRYNEINSTNYNARAALDYGDGTPLNYNNYNTLPNNGTGTSSLGIFYSQSDGTGKHNLTVYNASSISLDTIYPLTVGTTTGCVSGTCSHTKVPVVTSNATTLSPQHIQLEYGVLTNGVVNTSFTGISNITYDAINTNISILIPSWGQVYGGTATPALRIQYIGGFDNCSVMLNGNIVFNYSSSELGDGDITSDIITNSITGENSLNVSCYKDGNESHRYWYFVKSGSQADNQFTCAFGNTLSSYNCTTATETELSAKCTECYNTAYPYNFSAVVCPYLELSKDYSCLSSLSNVTKINNQNQNFTIFFLPHTWGYPAQNNNASAYMQHIGALFYFGSSPVNTGIELFNSTQFIYVPAQNRSRDCSVYYLTNNLATLQYCSYFGGFILNDRPVFIADRSNNWFVAAGQGIVYFNENYSNSTIPVSVMTVEPYLEGTDIFPNGIYTRSNCYIQNNQWYIVDLENTQDKLFTVQAVYNDTTVTYNYNITSQILFENISVYNISYISIEDNQGEVCYYDGTTTLFLPFHISAIELDAFSILTKVLFLFMVIISCFIPFGLLGAIIINDVYQIVDIPNMCRIIAFTAIAGLTINSFSFDRGIKHLFIILAIGVAYISALNEIEATVGTDFGAVTDLLTSAGNLTTCEGTTNCLWQFVSNTPAFVIQLFIFVLTLPVTVMELLLKLIAFISPAVATGIRPFVIIIMYASVIYFYLKAYEVLANKFKGV